MMSTSVHYIKLSDQIYPSGVKEWFGEAAPERLAAIGDLRLLDEPLTALFCSVKCPARLILRAHDLATTLQNARIAIAGGFHTPVEKECLRLLLRDRGPLIVCPARGIEKMRIPSAWRSAIQGGRLLLLSPFRAGERRATKRNAVIRNRFVAALARNVLIIYAAPGSKTEELCREALARGRTVYTLADDANAELVALGASVIGLDNVAGVLRSGLSACDAQAGRTALDNKN